MYACLVTVKQKEVSQCQKVSPKASIAANKSYCCLAKDAIVVASEIRDVMKSC